MNKHVVLLHYNHYHAHNKVQGSVIIFMYEIPKKANKNIWIVNRIDVQGKHNTISNKIC